MAETKGEKKKKSFASKIYETIYIFRQPIQMNL